jgi:hypothetical protein
LIKTRPHYQEKALIIAAEVAQKKWGIMEDIMVPEWVMVTDGIMDKSLSKINYIFSSY